MSSNKSNKQYQKKCAELNQANNRIKDIKNQNKNLKDELKSKRAETSESIRREKIAYWPNLFSQMVASLLSLYIIAHLSDRSSFNGAAIGFLIIPLVICFACWLYKNEGFKKEVKYRDVFKIAWYSTDFYTSAAIVNILYYTLQVVKTHTGMRDLATNLVVYLIYNVLYWILIILTVFIVFIDDQVNRKTNSKNLQH